MWNPVVEPACWGKKKDKSKKGGRTSSWRFHRRRDAPGDLPIPCHCHLERSLAAPSVSVSTKTPFGSATQCPFLVPKFRRSCGSFEDRSVWEPQLRLCWCSRPFFFFFLYSLPYEILLDSVKSCNEENDELTFRNSSGVSRGCFLELLQFYLNSTLI